MKVVDVIFALICGRIVAQISQDFLKGYGIEIGFYKWILYFSLPIVSLICLWLAYLIGKKLLFVFQVAKYFLVGIFVTVIDLKLFELLIWIFSFFYTAINPIISKGISFLVSIFIKYWGNKHWTFEKPGKDGLKSEIFQFVIVTIVGLGVDVGSFYYFTKIMGSQFGTPENVWVKLSVIFAALVAAVWNFIGYKFLVFKK
ncbi:MAG: GtrA family protein [Candidatus Staskawiczbacteria bacterium]|nr:GtrA family protein [Candidatus Staskawiczbacteria bacterium]